MTPQHETTPEGRGPPAGPSTIEKQQQAGIASSEEGGSISSGSADASPVRPASIKRVRTSEADLSGLEISIPPPASTAAPATATATGVGAGGLLGSPPLLPPPPDCPPYLQASQLPVWVGRAPVGAEQQQQLTPERVDELHHVQWRAWKGEGQSGGDRDYGRILEVAPSLFHAAFARMNPHNCAITVGITVDAMHATGAPPLVCATTFLYGLSLLADNPSKQTIPLQFCRGAPRFMAEWAAHAFKGEEEGRAIESLLEFCGVFPCSGLPDALGKRVEAHVERLMGLGKEKEALGLIKRCLEAPWADQQRVWDEDIYWKLRLLSYICKRRAQAKENRLPTPPHPPVTVKMACLVYRKSAGRLPRSLEEVDSAGGEGDGLVECGMELSEEQVQASLAAMRESFAQFAESFLALTKGTVQWELVLKPEYDMAGDPHAVMPARPFHREVEAPTNPNRLIAQADVDGCAHLAEFVRRKVEEQGDEDLRDAQALLVIWPGLKAPGSYMLTCGGITPHGFGGRAVFMSDGAMLTGRPVWSPMWFHHETFHVMEHVFPEAHFSEASQLCGHPVFLRDQWPCHYDGFYEWDFYYNSYKTAILHPSTHPPLPARLARRPGQPHTHALDAARREAATILARLALPGDTVLLRCSAPHGAALGFKPGALPEGVTLQPAEGGGGQGEWSLAAHWVQSPPCYLLTMAKGGKGGHEALLDALLACSSSSSSEWEDNGNGSASSLASSPNLSGRGGAGGGSSNSSSKPPSPAHGGGGGTPRSGPGQGQQQQVPRESLLKEGQWPVAALRTGAFAGFAQQAVERCIQEGRCTFAATGASWMPQPYYVCRTCRELNSTNPLANVGCCLPCAARCHVGHDLEPRSSSRFYCDCGLGNYVGLACQCLHPPADDQQQDSQQGNGNENEWLPAELLLGSDGGESSRDRMPSPAGMAAMPPLILVSAAPPALNGVVHAHAHHHGHDCGH